MKGISAEHWGWMIGQETRLDFKKFHLKFKRLMFGEENEIRFQNGEENDIRFQNKEFTVWNKIKLSIALKDRQGYRLNQLRSVFLVRTFLICSLYFVVSSLRLHLFFFSELRIHQFLVFTLTFFQLIDEVWQLTPILNLIVLRSWTCSRSNSKILNWQMSGQGNLKDNIFNIYYFQLKL